MNFFTFIFTDLAKELGSFRSTNFILFYMNFSPIDCTIIFFRSTIKAFCFHLNRAKKIEALKGYVSTVQIIVKKPDPQIHIYGIASQTQKSRLPDQPLDQLFFFRYTVYVTHYTRVFKI